MNILLLHYADKKIKTTEPLGICYIAAYLREKGYNVDLFDSRVKGYELDDYIEEVNNISSSYGIIGITCCQLFGEKKESTDVKKIVGGLRENGFNGHITTGGYGPTINWGEFIEIGVDSVIIGEGEIIFYNLVYALDKKDNWRNVKGLAYVNDRGEKVINEPEELPDFENLPFPARDILEGFADKYGVSQMNPLIQGSRGCYMKCAYCSTPVFIKMQGGIIYRNRSIKRLVDEIESLYIKGYRTFDFVDDNFLPPKPEDALNRAKELRDELKKRNIIASFFMEFRLEYITREILEILKDAGVRKLLIGVESFNEQDLRLYNRTYSLDKMHTAIEAIFSVGYGSDLNSKYRFRFGFININPLSTIDTLRNNGQFLKKYNLTFKKFKTRLLLYDNNSTILSKVLKEFPQYTKENYFKDKRVSIFYEYYSQYDKKYVSLRNKGRNIEKFINKRIALKASDLDYLEMLKNLEELRHSLDEDVYIAYMNGLDYAEKDNYADSLKDFYDEMNVMFNQKFIARNKLLEDYSKKLGFEFYGTEMFFN